MSARDAQDRTRIPNRVDRPVDNNFCSFFYLSGMRSDFFGWIFVVDDLLVLQSFASCRCIVRTPGVLSLGAYQSYTCVK